MRLDKYLAHTGFGTRKEVKSLISSGQVLVNGQVVKKVGYQVVENQDLVQVDGQTVHYEQFTYLMVHKPQGVLSATEDRFSETVLDLIGPEYGHLSLFPIGRLDKDTTGLLILTNDGQLAHRLLSPKHHVDKTYQAWVQGPIDQAIIECFVEGLDLGDFITMPAGLKVLDYDPVQDLSFIEVTIQEGKFHQVKRMFEKVGSHVITLHRNKMGPISLDQDLPEGAYRPLNSEEINALMPYGLGQD